MTRTSRLELTSGAACLLLAFSLISGPSFAAPSGSTDIQWAQTVLKERGFDPGRADGRATDKTKAALRAFQTASGLPDTGTLDTATTARLMSTRKPPASTGTLRAPAASASLAPATAPANAGSGGSAAAGGGGGGFSGPRAAPTERVSASGTGSASLLTAAGHRAPVPSLGSRAPSTATSTSPSTASPPAPTSPTLSPAARAGQSTEMTEPETKGLSMETRRILSWGIIGIAGMTLLGFALLWWRSGPQYPWRRRAPAVGTRRIPRLTHGASGCLMPGVRGARVAVSH